MRMNLKRKSKDWTYDCSVKASHVNNNGSITDFSCFEISFAAKNFGPWLYFPVNFSDLKKTQNTRKQNRCLLCLRQ